MFCEGHREGEAFLVARNAGAVIMEKVLHIGLQNIVDCKVLEKGETNGEEDALVSFIGLGDGGAGRWNDRDVVLPQLLYAYKRLW